MDCKDFREILDLYVDDELSPEVSTAAHLHLKECSPCRKAEGALLRMRVALKHVVLKHQPPPELVQNVKKLSQSGWRIMPGSGTKNTAHGPLLVWRASIRLPAPVFALLLISVVALGLLSAHLRSAQKPERTASPEKTSTKGSKPQQSAEKDALMDFSRFDPGGRISLYKVRR